MARGTDISVRNQIIYSVYIRNHTEEGTFRALIPDLPRIRALGADIIWLMPIHPIGVKGKKGSLGCPYANRDYRAVNPDYGTMEDFKALVDAIHALGMKCIIDVVYNHTSPDAVLTEEHPEFYYRKPNGSFGNKTAEWTDVIDLDYSVPALWEYQTETLKMWAKIVDGFRCDVASCVPVGFWKQARAEVAKVNPDCLWLGETVHGTFNLMNRVERRKGCWADSDSEMYEAFDIEYDYDIREAFDLYIEGKAPLSLWLSLLNHQEVVFPDHYSKLRCLENHDRPRAKFLWPEKAALENATAMLYFLKGTVMLYAGQEFACKTIPSLFEKDVFPRDTGVDLSDSLARLAKLRKEVLSAEDYFFATADDRNNIAVCLRDDGKRKKVGIFSLSGNPAEVSLCYPNGERMGIPDGSYENLPDGRSIEVRENSVRTDGEPILFCC